MELIEDLGMMYPNENSKKKTRYGLYRCPICKIEFKTVVNNVNRGITTKCKSCASKLKATKHGMKKHRLYHVWIGEKQRCYNKNLVQFKDYGARGITVSNEFHDFPTWLEYVESLDNAYSDGYSIDRINNNGNYERGNLAWSSRSTQSQNTRRIKRTNKSGYRGVSVSQNNKWIAQISHNNIKVYLGQYDTAEDAARSYDKYVEENKTRHTTNFNNG